jgi:catechol 2,3-dioxygenase-like lactoylglutathione lyase family enzyme
MGATILADTNHGNQATRMTDPTDPVPFAAPERPRIDLFMTVIRVTRWETTVRWYVDTLGLAPLLLDAANEFALLSAGSGRVGLQGVKEAHLAPTRNRVRLVFQVADLDRERRRLVDHGVEVGEPVENRDEGYREIRFQDPEGYSLRCFAWDDPGRAGAFGAH